jgi:hypothetical protein
MWILKTALLGLWLFGYGTMAFLYFKIFRYMPPNSAVSANVITWHTTHNPMWWTALAVCFAASYAIVRSWSAPLILWVAVFLTGLVPAGCLVLFAALATRLKHASQGHL